MKMNDDLKLDPFEEKKILPSGNTRFFDECRKRGQDYY